MAWVFLVASTAWAEPIRLTAQVDEDLATIHGVISVPEGVSVRAPSAVSQPSSDREQRHLVPGAGGSTRMVLTPDGPGRWRFHAVIPRRYSPQGRIPGMGLYMEDRWYPKVGNPAGSLEWEVEVALPEGSVGAIQGQLGEEILRWQGTADNLGLAVVPKGQIRDWPTPSGRLRVLSPRARPSREERRLGDWVAQEWPETGPAELVVVIAPDRTRLARSLPGMVFLSDRCFRLSGPLWRLHTRPVWDALFASQGVKEAPLATSPSSAELLKPLAWIPEVEALLNDGTLPFYQDVFTEEEREPPDRWTAVLAAFPSSFDIRAGRISAVASVGLRPPLERPWLVGATVATDTQDLVQGEVLLVRYLGPSIDGRRRPVALWGTTGAGWLDPNYRPTPDGELALEGAMGARWDTRTDDVFPRRGARVGGGGEAGWVPGSDARWSSMQASVAGLWPIGGRLVHASRFSGGLASGTVEHRLLDLGGPNAILGLPTGEAIGLRRWTARSELRLLAMQQGSVPLPLAWLSHVQVSAGVESGYLARLEGAPQQVFGWVGGVVFTADVLGARPSMLAITAGRPLWVTSELEPVDSWPQLWVGWGQDF